MTIHKHFRNAKILTKLLDSQFEVYGFRFGLDPLIGLIPYIGNIVTTATSLYLFWIAWRMRVAAWVYAQMVFNIVLDALATSIPIIGTIFDFIYKSNERNLRLLSHFIDPDVLEGEVIS